MAPGAQRGALSADSDRIAVQPCDLGPALPADGVKQAYAALPSGPNSWCHRPHVTNFLSRAAADSTAAGAMRWKTAATEMLGIEYPIVSGGMTATGSAELAAAVSNAGGLGMLTCLHCRTPLW